MILAARKPLSHKAFIDFVAISSIIHALIMLFYAEHRLHLAVDVVSMGLMGALPLIFYPWGLKNLLRYR